MTNKKSKKANQTLDSFLYPQLDPNFYIEEDKKILLDFIQSQSEQNPINAMLVGPQGCGKTETAIWFAAKNNRPLLIMNCAATREPKDWFGSKEAADGSTYWKSSLFVKAVQEGYVILLDEFNRVHTSLHNTLYPLLDDRRKTYIEDLDEVLTVHPNTVFFATCNIGFSHGGTFQLDGAIDDRFVYKIDCDFLPPEIEADVIQKKADVGGETATRLVRLASKIRTLAAKGILDKTCSLRQLIKAGQMMNYLDKIEVNPAKALEFVLINNYSGEGGQDSQKSQVIMAVQTQFSDYVSSTTKSSKRKSKSRSENSEIDTEGMNLDWLDD